MNDHGTMTITGCTISNNSASQYGLTVTSEGGGILNHSGSLVITNSTISGNSCSAFSPEPLFAAVAFGGGISKWWRSSKLRAVPSHIILHQVIKHSAVGFMELGLQEQTAVS